MSLTPPPRRVAFPRVGFQRVGRATVGIVPQPKGFRMEDHVTNRKPAPRTSLITRTTCRICRCPHLAPVLSLGDQRIAGAFADPGGDQPVERRSH